MIAPRPVALDGEMIAKDWAKFHPMVEDIVTTARRELDVTLEALPDDEQRRYSRLILETALEAQRCESMHRMIIRDGNHPVAREYQEQFNKHASSLSSMLDTVVRFKSITEMWKKQQTKPPKIFSGTNAHWRELLRSIPPEGRAQFTFLLKALDRWYLPKTLTLDTATQLYAISTTPEFEQIRDDIVKQSLSRPYLRNPSLLLIPDAMLFYIHVEFLVFHKALSLHRDIEYATLRHLEDLTTIILEKHPEYAGGLAAAAERLKQSHLRIEPAALSDLTEEKFIDLLVRSNGLVFRILNACDIKFISNEFEIDMLNDISILLNRKEWSKAHEEALLHIWKNLRRSERNLLNLRIIITPISTLGPTLILEALHQGPIDIYGFRLLVSAGRRVKSVEDVFRLLNRRKDRKGPIVAIMNAKEDLLGGFGVLLQDALRVSQERNVDITYTGSLHEIAENAQRIVEQRGLINTLILNMHGTSEGFSLAPSQVITKLDLEANPDLETIRATLAPNAICYVNSCEAGKGRNPIAKVLARRLETTVIAPDSKTPGIIKERRNAIVVTFTEGKAVRFN